MSQTKFQCTIINYIQKKSNFVNMIKTNSPKAWLLASRPQTLTGAAAPIIIALSAAYHVYGHLDWTAALLCLFFALLMQIDANFVNDYFDFAHGIDDEQRLGPKRACAQGWITPKAMLWGITIITIMACVVGLPLIAWGGWECIIVGVACVVFCFLYTTLFSRIAMGDILVLLFFGIIPIGYTYFFQSHHDSILHIPLGVWMLALAQGLVTDCLLLVNNFRDRDTDKRVGKITLVNIIGEKPSLFLYEICGILAAILAHYAIFILSDYSYDWKTFVPYVFIGIHSRVAHSMHRINHGSRLNMVLGYTARSILIFSILVSLALIL